MNERRASIQNDLPENINVIQQGSSDSEMELNTNSENEKKKINCLSKTKTKQSKREWKAS